MRPLILSLSLFCALFTTAQLDSRRDPYAVLGLPSSASFDELQTAHRALARRFHPDKCASPACASTFLDLQAAYAVVSDPVKRRVYDAHGHSGLDRLEERRRQVEWHDSVRSTAEPPDSEPAGDAGSGAYDEVLARAVGGARRAALALAGDPWPLATLGLSVAALRALRRRQGEQAATRDDVQHAAAAEPAEPAPVVVNATGAGVADGGLRRRVEPVVMPQSVVPLNSASVASGALPTSPGVYLLLLLIPSRPPQQQQQPPTGMQQHASLRRYGSAVAAARSIMASLATHFADEPKLAFRILDAEQHPKWRAFAAAEATACGGLPLIAWRPGASRRRYCRIMAGASRSTHGPDVAAIARQRVELLLTGGIPGDRWLEGSWLELDA